MIAVSSVGYATGYPQPGRHQVTKAKDYYMDGYGYDSSKDCSGPMCIPVGSIFTCSSYQNLPGPAKGTQVQICNMASIVTPHGSVIRFEEGRYTTATGFIRDNGEFIAGVPKNSKFVVDNSPLPTPIKEPSEDLPTPITEGEVCDANCGTGERSRLQELADSVIEAVTPVLERLPKSQTIVTNRQVADALRPLWDTRINNKCKQYIREDGSVGPWGREVLENFKTVCNECFFGPNNVDVSNVCPKFQFFDQETKERFWVWTVMSMTQKESSCNPRANVRGTRVGNHWERAVGLLQMEQSYHRRKYPKRGIECTTDHKNGETVFDIGFQFRCSASIIRDTRWKRGVPLVGGGLQYWQEMRESDQEIPQLIRKFPGCR